MEAALALLLELAPEGVEEAERPDAGVELAVYGDDARAAAVRAVLPEARVEAVRAGWEEAWRSFHRPVVAGGVWIGPPWLTTPPGVPRVVIDPGQAFGTGAHPTTRLCVELLAGLPRGSLLDVGCGSGVLAIAAAALGFGPVAGLDVDPVAVEVATGNCAANGAAVALAVDDAASAPLPGADVAVANVSLAVVTAVLARLPARDVVTSGYLASERPAATGWSHRGRLELDGWAADHFTRATP